MIMFKELSLYYQLQYTIDNIGFEHPMLIQQEVFNIFRSAKDVLV